jgi:hypothetical protein
MKVDSDVLLLSYLDKICLTLTGDLWPALACLYSEARLYKGAMRQLALSRLHCILQATSCERRKSAIATHVEQ